MTLARELRIASVVNANGLHYAKMRQRQRLAGALLVKAVTTVSAVVLSICEREGGPASHAHIRVNPLGGLQGDIPLAGRLQYGAQDGSTHRTAVNHAAGDRHSRWELVSLVSQRLVHLANIGELVPAFGSRCPRLYQFQDLRSDLWLHSSGANSLQQRREVVHELPRRDLNEEVRPAIFHTRIGQLQTMPPTSVLVYGAYPAAMPVQTHAQRTKLRVRILVADASFERSHSLLWLNRLRSDDIGYLEVQRNVFSARLAVVSNW